MHRAAGSFESVGTASAMTQRRNRAWGLQVSTCETCTRCRRDAAHIKNTAHVCGSYIRVSVVVGRAMDAVGVELGE